MPTTKGVLLCAALIAGGAPALADPVEDFYKGKTVNLIIGAASGAGLDLYGRLIGKHLGKYIPGNPTVVVQYQPGAVSLQLTNNVYNTLPQDGTVIAQLNRAVITEPLYGNAEAKFDPLKLNWLGSPSQETSVAFSWYTTPFRTLDDLRKKEMVVGGEGPGGSATINSALLKQATGIGVKVVYGYSGFNDSILASERGEIDGKMGQSWGVIKSNRPDLLRDKKIIPFLQFGLRKEDELPDIPLLIDFATQPDVHQLAELLLARQSLAYPFVTTPNVPADRLKAMRAGYDAVLKDKEFLDEAAKSGIDIKPVNAEAALALVKRTYETPKEVVDRAKAIR
jgi:tripartite-type tricarboxylate transporter receptor subunit TctC